MEAALLVVGVLVVIAAVVFSYYRKKKRREQLAAFAWKNGFQFSASDTHELLSLDFKLFSMGDGRGCENVMWGDLEGIAVKAADYWYYTESSDSKGRNSKSYRHFSVVVADISAYLPHVIVTRENVFTRVADYLSFRDIEFESEEFNRSFQVKADDRAFAFKLIDARVMNWMMSTDGRFAFEVSGPNLLVYSRRVRPSELVPLFGTAKEFHDRIPRLVRSEYGTQARESS
jgi:hypothetical protein